MTKVLINVRVSKDVLEKMDILCKNKGVFRPELISELVKSNFDFTDKLEFKINAIVEKKLKEKEK